jgi:nitric oxide reductase subunit B
LLISIPTLNWFTHGTTITVAHAMGSTIGINTMVLFGAGFTWIYSRTEPTNEKPIWWGLGITNFFLLAFFLVFILAGSVKGLGMVRSGWSFNEAREHLTPLMGLAGWMGVGLLFGLLLLLHHWFTLLLRAGRTVGNGDQA